VAVTGHTEKEYIEQARASGMNEIYSKPISHLEIKEALSLSKSPFQSLDQSLASERSVQAVNQTLMGDTVTTCHNMV